MAGDAQYQWQRFGQCGKAGSRSCLGQSRVGTCAVAVADLSRRETMGQHDCMVSQTPKSVFDFYADPPILLYWEAVCVCVCACALML